MLMFVRLKYWFKNIDNTPNCIFRINLSFHWLLCHFNPFSAIVGPENYKMTKKTKLRHFPWAKWKCPSCSKFNFEPEMTRFSIFFSDFLVIFEYILALNVLSIPIPICRAGLMKTCWMTFFVFRCSWYAVLEKQRCDGSGQETQTCSW